MKTLKAPKRHPQVQEAMLKVPDTMSTKQKGALKKLQALHPDLTETSQ